MTMIMISVLLLFVLVEFKLAASCAYGEGCRFPCRCQTGGCDPVTGNCSKGGCAAVPPTGNGYGWTGSGCRIGNIAYNKSTSQSGVWLVHTSDRAVDGNTNPNLDVGHSCAHPATNEDNNKAAWWMVDLGKKHIIEEMVIWNRNMLQKRTNDFDIYIGMSSEFSEQDQCVYYNGGGKSVLNLTCTGNVKAGQYLRIQRRLGPPDADHKYINICEFVVIGYEPIECSDKCIGTCNDLTGCDTCAKGHKLPDCIDGCDNGAWGINCANMCSDKCTGTCDARTGCSECDVGFKLPECSSGCDNGTWGLNCANMCSDKCTGTCDARTGCNECAAGYKLSDCTELCNSATWGKNCVEQCGKCADSQACDPHDGECKGGCDQWWLNTKCNTEIETPSLQNSNIRTVVYSSSSMSVAWQQDHIRENLERYYFYRVEYGLIRGTKHLSQKVPHTSKGEVVSFNLTDLTFNTEYEVSVIPYREHNDDEEIGVKSAAIIDKTMCTAPSEPTLEVINTDHEWKIVFQALNNLTSGCDTVISYDMYMLSNNWNSYAQNRSILNDSYATFQYGMSSNGSVVWITVTNNDNMTTPSVKKHLIYFISTTVAPTTQAFVSMEELQATRSPESDIGAIAGGAASVVVVAVVVGVVIFVVLRRRRSPKSETRKLDNIDSPHLAMEEPDAAATENVYANSEDVAFPSTCIKISQLEVYIQHKQDEVDGFQHEYSSIPAGYIHPVTRASESQTLSRNRFKNIKAYDKSRVVLEVDSGEPSSDYINACFIPGYNGDGRYYIAGQGPLPHTISDHWRMIWQYDVTRIVMVTKEVELGKHKCARYWPDKVGDAKEYGSVTVSLREVEEYADFTIRKLKCSKSDESKNVTQFHFTSWPDKQALEEALSLLQFSHKVNMYPKTGPLFVHCSAGIGRTGTYIAVDYLIDQGLAEDKLDVHQCVLHMREYRMNLVQTLAQYEFIYKALLEAFTFKDTSIPSSELDTRIKAKRLQAAKQYQDIARFTNSTCSQEDTCDGHRPENKKKNRDLENVPTDSHRPYLKTPWKSGNDYINAVYVNSYRRPRSFIVTQFPLANTVVDFWRLVYDHNCVVSVSLGAMEQKEEPQGGEVLYANFDEKNVSTYLPKQENNPETYGPLEVVVKSNTYDNSLTKRKMTVKIPKHESIVDTTHIEMREWADGELPQIDTFMEVIKQVEQFKLESDGPVVISCLNGADKSGLLVAALYMTEYMKLEQEVDVVTAVRSVRKYRKQFVNSQKQYEYLYSVAQSYNQMFSTYANYL